MTSPSIYPVYFLQEEDAVETPAEIIGAQPKQWFLLPPSGQYWLFKSKSHRPETGLDWADKLAAELAGLVEVPHAQVELAERGGEYGIVCRSFLPQHVDSQDEQRTLLPRTSGFGTIERATLIGDYERAPISRWELEHGNDILYGFNPGYPRDSNRREPEHTLERVFQSLVGTWLAPSTPPDERLDSAEHVLVGYFLLDAWICNTDRHHLNWGVLREHPSRELLDRRQFLAPSFDHAASLGQELRDADRVRRARDPNAMRAYYERARSGLYLSQTDKHPAHPLAVFRSAAARYPQAARAWLERLDGVSDADIIARIDAFPPTRMSVPARDFCARLLRLSRERLLSLTKELP